MGVHVLCMAVSAEARLAGQLSGSVSDQTGAPLPAARVTVRGVVERAATSSATGEFAFPDLPEGDYAILAELAGFEPARRDVRVRTGERVTVSLVLRVAMIEETIVTAAKEGKRDVQDDSDGDLRSARLPTSRAWARRSLGQAAPIAPSVTLSQNTSFAQLTIRGIGANVVNAGSDPSSAMYLDGVYLARPAMAFMQLFDLDRIEVLRGPQGTLYGRNAVGGALNLISKDADERARRRPPMSPPGILASCEPTPAIGGPLKRDKVMGSIAFARGVRDGYVHDLEHPDHPLGGDDVTAGRGQLRVVFNPRTDLLLSSDVDSQRGTPLTFNKVIAPKPGYTFDNPSGLHNVRASALAWNRTLQYGASARLTMALTPSTTLVSLTAYRDLDYEFFVDADITELDLITTHQHEWQHQLSQEITVSHQQPRLTWVGGVFLFDEFDHQSYWVDQMAPGIQVRLDPRVDATSRAVFGQATVGLTSRLSATAGLRYTNEGKDIDNAGGRYALEAPNLPVPGSVYGYSDSIAHDAWTPKFGLDMKLPNGSMAYVSATRGFKSGGFNPSSTAPGRGYAPEWAWSYEGGWKGTLMGGRSRFATSAFVMDYTNLQVQTPIGIGVFDIRNAAAATIRGVEVENTSRIGRGIEAGGHFTWLDATYDQYIAVNNLNVSRRCRGQSVEQRAGMGGTPVGRVGQRGWPLASPVDLSRVDGTVDGVLHAVQRQHPAAESVWPARRPHRIRRLPIAGGLSPRTSGTSRIRTSSMPASGRRRRRLADVPVRRASSLLISRCADRPSSSRSRRS